MHDKKNLYLAYLLQLLDIKVIHLKHLQTRNINLGIGSCCLCLTNYRPQELSCK